MAKKMRFSSRNSKNKLGDKRDKFKEDRISQLPDEVIGSILSLCILSEAARTSVLSRRWEKLWTLFNGTLNFDLARCPFTVQRIKIREQKRSYYIDWVNQVLASLSESSSSNINDFIVRFDSDEDFRCHIDRWVEFALERRVQRLQLDMRPVECPASVAYRRYTFSLEFCTRIKQPCGLYSITSLTSLFLKFVDVAGELIEYFLSNCPLLERLCVVDSGQLSNLKVTGAPTLQLKYLEISSCLNMETLQISAPNLVSFNYSGPRIIKLRVENVPQLVAVAIDMANVGSLSSYFSQLETLKLHIDTEVHKNFITQHLELPKLKHLIFKVIARNTESLLPWTSLIKGCPLLHRFTLELVTIHARFGEKMRKVIECPHQCLKVVGLVGFVRCSTDVELVMQRLANCSALEKIVINCYDPLSFGTQWEAVIDKAAKNRALQLKRKLPPGLDIVVV